MSQILGSETEEVKGLYVVWKPMYTICLDIRCWLAVVVLSDQDDDPVNFV